MGKEKNIMLVVPLLDQGGLERICALTAQLLKEEYTVHLAVFNTAGMIYDVSGIHLIDLNLGAVQGKPGKAVNLLRRAVKLSKLQKRLDISVVYSFGRTANIASALSLGKSGSTGKRVRKIAACHSFGEIKNRRYMKLILKRTDDVICCSRAMAAEVEESYHTQNIHAVWNPCDIDGIQEKIQEGFPPEYREKFSRKERLIVSMGREDDVKGFWHLIKAFKRVQEQMPDTRLMIIGEGKFEEYRELASKMGILPRVTFTGMQRNPFPFLAAGQVYVLSSISEGLPNALVEALAAGLAVVSANCKSGPAEILDDDWRQAQDRDGVQYADYGILTPALSPEKNMHIQAEDGKICLEEGEEALAGAIVELLQDQELYDRYRQKAAGRARDFSMEKYKEAVINLIGT